MRYPPMTLTAWLRYHVIERLLRRLDRVESVLEIGVGQGAVGARLASRFAYLGLEMDDLSFARAADRIGEHGGTVWHGDPSTLPPGATFDLVCAFEVLEHIEDDKAALREWRNLLRPKGWLMLSVPAFQRRYGPWDIEAGHFRRYEREAIHDLLVATGYEKPLVWTYGFPLGYLLEAVRNALARRANAGGSMTERTAASGRRLQPPEAFGWATRLGSAVFRRLQQPFLDTRLGIGLVALARRAD